MPSISVYLISSLPNHASQQVKHTQDRIKLTQELYADY